MSKFCPNCGKELPNEVSFCNNCGANVAGNSNPGAMPNQTTIINNYNQPAPRLTSRSIVTAIILSLVTCGIYSIYWFIVLTDESNRVSTEPNETSGAMAFVLTLITCGIYGFYWYYKMGKKLYNAGQAYGKNISDNSLVYIILGLFGLGIVNYCLIQSDLNKFAE